MYQESPVPAPVQQRSPQDLREEAEKAAREAHMQQINLAARNMAMNAVLATSGMPGAPMQMPMTADYSYFAGAQAPVQAVPSSVQRAPTVTGTTTPQVLISTFSTSATPAAPVTVGRTVTRTTRASMPAPQTTSGPVARMHTSSVTVTPGAAVQKTSPPGSARLASATSKKLRKQKSAELDEVELTKAMDAANAFSHQVSEASGKEEAEAAEKEGAPCMRHRENWKHYQELLKRVTELHKISGDDTGELETETDRALGSYDAMASKVLASLRNHAQKPTVEGFVEDTFIHPALKGCAFVGHVATDLDSIAGAMGAAELFEGTATKAEAELNGEIKYALTEVAKLEEPPLFDDVPGCAKPDESGELKKICLVDHNEVKQMVKALREDEQRMKRIVGLIDHHALSESFSSEAPLIIDVRPWGCMSTIVAHMYVRSNARMRPEIARLLMCAILSDTLNLQSVTTTDADRFAVALLAKIGGVEDPDQVARLMFRAKTSWIVNLGPYAMVRGDQKDFSADGWKYGIAVLEVTNTQPVLECAADLILELRALKIEKGGGVHADQLDFAFLFVVDVVNQCSVLLVCGGREHALVKAAFPGCPFEKANEAIKAPGKTIAADQTLCEVGPLVSRKAQFVPAFAKALNDGFTCHKERVSSPGYKEASDDQKLREVLKAGASAVSCDDMQRLKRVSSEEATAAIFGVDVEYAGSSCA